MNSRATGISFIGALILTIVVVLTLTYFMTGKSSLGISSIVKTEVEGQKDVGKSNISKMIPPTCSGSYNSIRGIDFPADCPLTCPACANCADCKKCEGSAACISDSTSSDCTSIMDTCKVYRECIAQQYCLQKSGCTVGQNCKCENGACVNN